MRQNRYPIVTILFMALIWPLGSPAFSIGQAITIGFRDGFETREFTNGQTQSHLHASEGRRVVKASANLIAPQPAPPIYALPVSRSPENFSNVAQRQFNEPVFQETMAPVGFEQSNVGVCNCNRRGCRLCQRAKTFTYEVRNRELPAGDMSSRFPSQAQQLYYYHRPYGREHVSAESMMNTPSQNPSNPYSNWQTESLHRQTQQDLTQFSMGQSERDLVEDGYLEFADWRTHQKARQESESTQIRPAFNAQRLHRQYPR
jgi:hypothetical protein